MLKGERVEHDNPADYYNTILKMAKKRAYVDAIITATACSDIFTQDLEEMEGLLHGVESKMARPATPPDPAPAPAKYTLESIEEILFACTSLAEHEAIVAPNKSAWWSFFGPADRQTLTEMVAQAKARFATFDAVTARFSEWVDSMKEKGYVVQAAVRASWAKNKESWLTDLGQEDEQEMLMRVHHYIESLPKTNKIPGVEVPA